MINRRKRKALYSAFLLVASVACLMSVLVIWLKTVFTLERRPILFGSTYMTMDNQYFEVLNAFIENFVEVNGDRLVTRDPASSQQKQNEQILDMLDMGVDFIFVNPVDGRNVEPALKECRKRGVPFIAVDTEIYGQTDPVATVVSNNYEAGALIAQDVVAKLKNARIVVLYDNKISSTCARFKGFTDTLDESGFPYDIIYTASGTTLLHETMVEMQKFLDMHLDFDVVFAGNDPTALGALAAMQNNNVLAGQLVYGIDGSPSGKMMVSQGLMEATSAQFPSEIAYEAVSAAYRYLAGEAVKENIIVPVKLISKDTVDSLTVMSWQ
ncbi:MAG: substrate-binding domain-containing protein [Treponema sp.]|nr:substrate-binding domain-containing protein [Treponema sp.]